MGKKVNIVLCGGHAGSTAYAVIQEIKEMYPEWRIHFIGARSAFEGKKVMTLESVVFPKIGVKYLPLFTGRLQRNFGINTIPSLVKIPFGFIHALFYLAKIKPKVILSFGGFVSVPLVFAAYLMSIPVAVHEQTSSAGLSNILSSRFAKIIFISRPTSKIYFPKSKVMLTGNPISREIVSIKPKKSIGGLPVILVTGGSRGSIFINDNLKVILEKILISYSVIHQTGELQYSFFKSVRNKLEPKKRVRYEVHSLIPSWEWHNIIKKADIVVSRSGANIVSEILTLKKPAVLIPIPNTYKDEQLKNALLAKKFGVAEILKQEILTPQILYSTINKIVKNWHKIVSRASRKNTFDHLAAGKVVKQLSNLIN